MRNNKGFSLVELIVVIAIMAILAAVAIPTFAGFIGKAQKSNDEALLNDLEYAVELELAEEGGVPAGYAIEVTIASGKLSAIGWSDYSGTVTPAPSAPTVTLNDIKEVIDTDYTFKGLDDGTYTPDDSKPGHWKTVD